MKYSIVVLIFLVSSITFAEPYVLPENGLLFGAYVDAGPLADDLDSKTIIDFQTDIQKDIAWVYFCNNWLDGVIEFPTKSVTEAIKANVVPYIRLMPWSEVRASGEDPIFDMDVLLTDKYDLQLMLWALEAKKHNTHYILEFGPEVNGEWFAWNARWNGAGIKDLYGDPEKPDGAEKFVDVYKKIVNIFRKVGLTNVTWVLHLDVAGSPSTWWNRAEHYYPGDEYVDWIGLSVFGAQLPTHKWVSFEDKFRPFWPQIEALTLKKPLIISEFAVIEDLNLPNRKAEWLEDAFSFIESQEFPIRAATYWNSPGWLADGTANFRLNSSESSLLFIQKKLNEEQWVNP